VFGSPGTFRKQHRLRVCDNWLLRKTFGSKRDEVTLKWVTTK